MTELLLTIKLDDGRKVTMRRKLADETCYKNPLAEHHLTYAAQLLAIELRRELTVMGV